MNKLIISNGSYTSMIASTINKSTSKNNKHYFLGYFKKIHSNNIKTHNEFAKVIIHYEESLNFFNYYKYGIFNTKKFLSEINNATIDELYIPINSTTKRWVKIFLRIFPSAKIHLYEEGLMSYIKPMFDRSLRKIMKKSTNHYIFYNEPMENYLKTTCPNITFNKINKNDLISSLDTYNKKLNIDFSNFIVENKKYALILPQYYYENSKKKMAIILKEYQNIVSDLIEDGYIVLFKDHPKAQNSFFTSLKPFFHEDFFKLVPHIDNYPIEIFIKQLDPKIIFSVYSTSLFSIKYLFGLGTFTSSKLLNQRMNISSIYPTLSCILTKNIISDICSKKDSTQPLIQNNIMKTNHYMLDLYIFILKKLL